MQMPIKVYKVAEIIDGEVVCSGMPAQVTSPLCSRIFSLIPMQTQLQHGRLN